jgi:hypothetical protein
VGRVFREPQESAIDGVRLKMNKGILLAGESSTGPMVSLHVEHLANLASSAWSPGSCSARRGGCCSRFGIQLSDMTERRMRTATRSIEQYQQQLLGQIERFCYPRRISQATVEAYRATPRHAFVRRYRENGSRQWHEVDEANLADHLDALYRNWALILFGEDDDNVQSTISQPSLVLLDMLRLGPGQIVLELGAGSG